jgi:antitoxin component YwqK of YwqJK toxin-antitoxin module
MENDRCDIIHQNGVKEKKLTVIDGYTIKYHANGKTMWSKGKVIDDQPDGYWEWYRIDGTLKRSGYFEKGEPVGEWVTYDNKGEKYKTTNRNKAKK